MASGNATGTSQEKLVLPEATGFDVAQVRAAALAMLIEINIPML